MAVGAISRFLEAIKQARSQVQVRPKEDRITSTESFFERARKRVVGVRKRWRKPETLLFLPRQRQAVRQAEERLLRWRQEASGVFGSPPNSRRFHAGIGTSAFVQLGGTTCNHKCQIKVPRRKRLSPKEVAEIFHLQRISRFVAEPGNHSWGEHPDCFIDDRDDHRSSRVALNAHPRW